jgi:peptidoglycan/LPS O-acetylase OafA/YrhL
LAEKSSCSGDFSAITYTAGRCTTGICLFGWSGVALFFVLSGFCIHYQTLTQRSPFRARTFFWRRFTRLYPAYLTTLLLVAALNRWHDGKACSWGDFVAHLLLVHNFSFRYFTSINGVFWSLAVECQFYLLYPLLLFLSRRGGPSGLRKRLGDAIVLNVLSYIFLTDAFPGGAVHVDWPRALPMMTWCDWILGACIAEAYVKGRRFFPHPRTALAASLLLFIVSMNFRPLVGEAFLFASFFFAVLLEAYLADESPLNARERTLIPIGMVSYSIYLWHEPVLHFLRPWVGPPVPSGPGTSFWLHFLVVLLAITLVSTLSYYLLEVQARRLLIRLGDRLSAPRAALPDPILENSRPS